MTSSNERQVGGSHYAGSTLGEIQHWDYAWLKFGRGYFQGQITKYVERYHKKNGVQDLQKALHFLEKLIELESQEPAVEVDCNVKVGTPICRDCGSVLNTAHRESCVYRMTGASHFVDWEHCNSSVPNDVGPDPSRAYVNQD